MLQRRRCYLLVGTRPPPPPLPLPPHTPTMKKSEPSSSPASPPRRRLNDLPTCAAGEEVGRGRRGHGRLFIYSFLLLDF